VGCALPSRRRDNGDRIRDQAAVEPHRRIDNRHRLSRPLIDEPQAAHLTDDNAQASLGLEDAMAERSADLASNPESPRGSTRESTRRPALEDPPRIIDFERSPANYRHWRLNIRHAIADLVMDVDETATLFGGYQLKLNSYDLGVDIELADALQRLRFEHPEVKVVVLRSGKDRVFCAGANIRMLAGASHGHKVNFCKFTNETRNGMEDSSTSSGQKFVCAVKGTAAGGGYELALSCDRIVLLDDGNSTISLPELPLLAVLPGTGGLTRVTDKRKVRRDRADAFCTMEEGIKGRRAVEWRLVDRTAPASRFDAVLDEIVGELAATSDRPGGETGICLPPLGRSFEGDALSYSSLRVEIDRAARRATLVLQGPTYQPPETLAALHLQGAGFHALRLARELDDAILHLRFNEPGIGTLVFRSEGDPSLVLAQDAFLTAHAGHWLVREIVNNWKRVLKRIDVTSRSLVTLVEPGSCFAGTLAELVFAADRAFMRDGAITADGRAPATLGLGPANFGAYPMSNGLTRLETRFLGEPETLARAKCANGLLGAAEATSLGLVTESFDEIDWDDEVRIFLEERASFSADGLTAMEANLRFAGPETMETKIFGRLTAWQNWVFQRPSAVGPDGALKRYGTGLKADFDPDRV
jgi:benzoyl-CoA-dihydrodiol lyase